MSYLWRHGPMLSAPPEKIISHYIEEDQKEVFEKAVFLLENGKYLYIRYFGPIDNENCGVTDIEEFSTLNEASEVYNEH